MSEGQVRLSPEELNRLRASFLRGFASVPEPLRREIIVVVDGAPFSWLAAFSEINGGTKTGDLILQELKKLKVIG